VIRVVSFQFNTYIKAHAAGTPPHDPGMGVSNVQGSRHARISRHEKGTHKSQDQEKRGYARATRSRQPVVAVLRMRCVPDPIYDLKQKITPALAWCLVMFARPRAEEARKSSGEHPVACAAEQQHCSSCRHSGCSSSRRTGQARHGPLRSHRCMQFVLSRTHSHSCRTPRPLALPPLSAPRDTAPH